MKNLNKNKNLIFFITLFFIIIMNYFNFIGFKEIKDDPIDYLKYTLNFAVNNTQSLSSHQGEEFYFDDDRSIGYSYINSLFLKSNREQIKTKSLDCFLKGEDQFCKKIIIKLQKINFFYYFIICISIILITHKLTEKISISFLSGILFSINTFFLSSISFLNPEIVSTFLVLWLGYFSYTFFKTSNKFSIFFLIITSAALYFFKPVFIFYFLFLILTSIIFNFRKEKKRNNYMKILKLFIIFSISICPLYTYKFFNTKNFNNSEKITEVSDTIKKIKDNYYKKYSKNKSKNFMKDYNFNDQLLPDNTGGEALLSRAVHGMIDWKEIPALIVSYIPKINLYLLDKFFDEKKIERVKTGDTFEGRNRNYFLIYRKYISEDYLMENGYNIKEINTLKKSIIIYLSNPIKQIVLTPIFAFRGIMGATNISDIIIRFNKSNFNLIIYSIFAITTFILQIVSLSLLIFIFLKNFFIKKKNTFIYFIAAPAYSIIFHSAFTHYIGRYSEPLIAIAFVFLMIFLYQLIQKKKIYE